MLPAMRKVACALTLVGCISCCFGQDAAEIPVPKDPQAYSAWACIPPRLAERFVQSKLVEHYRIAYESRNPFYLPGDFDGDGAPDFAVALSRKGQKEPGQDVVLLGNGQVRWLEKEVKIVYPGPA